MNCEDMEGFLKWGIPTNSHLKRENELLIIPIHWNWCTIVRQTFLSDTIGCNGIEWEKDEDILGLNGVCSSRIDCNYWGNIANLMG